MKDRRPEEGLMLYTPLKAAGIDTDPPLSEPIPMALPLSACTAPSPGDEVLALMPTFSSLVTHWPEAQRTPSRTSRAASR